MALLKPLEFRTEERTGDCFLLGLDIDTIGTDNLNATESTRSLSLLGSDMRGFSDRHGEFSAMFERR